MVYALVHHNPFSTTVMVSIIGAKGSNLQQVAFLDPANVDQVSKIGLTPMEEGYPVDPSAVPKGICWESKNKKLPDAVKCRGVDVVSEAVRDVIERFEPGVHQFLPVDVYRPKEKVPFAHHYWMVICRRIDSADEVHTTNTRYPSRVWQRGGGKFVFSRTAIGDAHLWRDPWIAGSILCSQALGDAFAATEVTGLYLQPLEEV